MCFYVDASPVLTHVKFHSANFALLSFQKKNHRVGIRRAVESRKFFTMNTASLEINLTFSSSCFLYFLLLHLHRVFTINKALCAKKKMLLFCASLCFFFVFLKSLLIKSSSSSCALLIAEATVFRVLIDPVWGGENKARKIYDSLLRNLMMRHKVEQRPT
jgi:hypothetical protein